MGAKSPSHTWFLAEGSTWGGLQTWILVQNPQPSAALVEITYMTERGPVRGPSSRVPAYSRESFDVARTVPETYGVSAEVISDIPVVVERAVYGGGYSWGHCSTGATAAARTWYLAEGSTDEGFETWILVQNPSDEWVDVALTYMTPTGDIEGPSSAIPPNSRRTFDVSREAGVQPEVSTMVAADAPVVAERAVYGPGREWGHDSLGAAEPDTLWFLAEGCTAEGFETWILVQNPDDISAEVTLTYMTRWGDIPGPSLLLPARSRGTFDVSETLPDTWEVSMRVDSSRPIVAERAMYGPGRAWGHDSVGTASPAETWYLAEGSTGSGFDTWVLVQNPGGATANVGITYMTDSGVLPGPWLELPADSRATFNVRDTVGSRFEVSAVVRSDEPVVVERAMYGERSDVAGARLP
jgi:hypothetical protein